MPATAVVSLKLAAAGAPSSAAAPVPTARKTRYPAAPVTAVHVRFTPVVTVPSVAASPAGAATLRQPVSAALTALSPAAVVAFTV